MNPRKTQPSLDLEDVILTYLSSGGLRNWEHLRITDDSGFYRTDNETCKYENIQDYDYYKTPMIISYVINYYNENSDRISPQKNESDIHLALQALLDRGEVEIDKTEYSERFRKRYKQNNINYISSNSITSNNTLKTIDSEYSQTFQIPRVWSFVAYFLPLDARRRSFEPSYNEFIDDYSTVWLRTIDQSTRTKRWLTIGFTFRLIILWTQCIAAWSYDNLARFMLNLLKIM